MANLLKLFAPRPPLPYLPPVGRDPVQVKRPQIGGLAAFLDRCTDHDKDYVPAETVEERRERKILERKKKAEANIEMGLARWDPGSDGNVTSDPYKTLFVGRLSYDTTEKQLKREFELYGPVVSVRIVKDKTKDPEKSRGYAFVEFERERDLTTAYKEADGVKLDGRRILVDVERGRTVKGWRPRRLGGGLGGTRIGGPDVNQKYSGRDGGVGNASGGGDRDNRRRDDRERDHRRDDRDRGGWGGGDRNGGFDDRRNGGGFGGGFRDDRRNGGGFGGGYDDRRGSGDRGRGGGGFGREEHERRRSRSPGRADRGRDDR
ncbi:hypothetical protein HDU76_002610 [Blyttiomyces sp. JEL0837]|nr:hypothetical protein HDU76_002610 [Blyttiomyces sp. JEL0837]